MRRIQRQRNGIPLQLHRPSGAGTHRFAKQNIIMEIAKLSCLKSLSRHLRLHLDPGPTDQMQVHKKTHAV